MSTKVDNRVVKMTFDNAQFQKGIKNTMDTLTEFEKKLKMDGASAGFNKVKEAAQNLDLSALNGKAESAKNKFQELKDSVLSRFSEMKQGADSTDFSGLTSNAQSAASGVVNAMGEVDMSQVGSEAERAAQGFDVFKTIAIGALLSVGDEIGNFVTNKLHGMLSTINDYTFKPILEGFKEYETQMGSIQTIMANTGMDFNNQADIDIVNDALDELNHYADKTIYNFTEMTRNIGTFTAAGVDLDTAVSSIQGIANMAALSGSTSQQASTAMYQLSQAIAAGSLKLQDWNSVVNAGMGGQVFQEQLKATARAHGIAVDEMIEANGSFRESLQEGWITSDILTETLQNMTIQYDEVGDKAYEAAKEQLIASGYTEEAAVETLRLAKASEEAATKVRTWTQLWDTVKEAIGSQWTSIIGNLIGDFGQATDMFTRLSDAISGGVNSLLGGLVTAAEVYNKSGAYYLIMGGEQWDEATKKMERIPGALDWLIQAISGPLGAIKDAFDSVFSFGDEEVLENGSVYSDKMGEMFVGIAQAINEFTQSLVANDDVLTAIRQVSEAVFTVFKIGIQIVSDLVGIFFKLVEVIRIFVDPLINIAATIIGIVAGALTDLMNAVMGFIDPIRVAVGYSSSIIEAIRNIVQWLVQLIDIPGKLRAVADFIHDIFWGIYDFFNIPGILMGVIKAFTDFGDAVSLAFRIIKNEVKDKEIKDIGWAVDFKNMIDSIRGTLESLRETFSWLIDPIENFFNILSGKNKEADETNKKLFTLETYTKMIGDTVKNVADTIIRVTAPIRGLLESIISKVPELWNAFLNWGPVANILGIFGDAGNNIVNTFNNIVGGAQGASDGIHNAFSAIQNWDPFAGLNEFAEYWRTHSVDEIIADAIRIKDDFVGNIVGAFEYLKTATPKQMSIDFFNQWEKLVSDLLVSEWGLWGIINKIDSIFPGFRKSVEPFAEVLTDVVLDIYASIRDFIQPIADASEDIPSFFANLFAKIKDSIINGITNLNPHTLAGNFLKGFRGIVDWFKNTFPSIAEPLENVYKAISNFLSDITERADGFGGVFKNIGTKIADFFTGLPIIGDVFKSLSDWFTYFTTEVIPVGDIFDDIKQKVKDFLGIVDPQKVGDNVSGALELVGDKAEEAKTGLSGLVDAIDPAGIPGKLSNFIGTLKDDVKTKFDEFVAYITDWPTRLNELLQGLADAIPEDAINKFADIVERVIKNKVLLSTSNLFDGLGELARSAGKYMKGDNKSVIQKALDDIRSIAISLAIVAGALWIVSTIPQDRLWQSITVLGIMGLVIIAMDALGSIIKTKTKAEGVGDDLLKTSASLLVLSFALRSMVKTLDIFWQADPNMLIGGLIKVAGVLIVLYGVMKKFANGDSLKAGAGLALLSIGLNLMMGPIVTMAHIFDGKTVDEMIQMGVGIAALGGFVMILAAALNLVGKDGIKAGAGMLIMSVALLVIGEAIKNIAGLDTDKMAYAAIALIGIIAIFGAIVSWTEKSDLSKSAKALLIYSVALGVISFSLYQLAGLKVESLAAAGIALVALIAAIGFLTEKTDAKDIVKTSAALLVFGLSIAAMGLGLNMIASIDPAALLAGGLAIAGLMVALGVLTEFADAKDLVATAGSLIIFGASLFVMAAALSMLSGLDLVGPTIALGALIVIFGGLTAVLASIPGSVVVLIAFSLALIGVGAACYLIATAMNIAVDALAKFLMLGPLLTMFVNLIAQNVGNFALAAVGLGALAIGLGALGIALIGLGAGLTVFGIGATLAGTGLALITVGIRNFLTLLADLPVLVQNAITGIVTFITNFPTMLGEAISAIWTWLTTEVLPKIPEFIGQAIAAIGGFVEPFMGWVTETAIPAIGEFISGIGAKLQEWAPMVLDWITNTAIPAMGDFIKNFWNWIQTEGWPAAVEFIKGFIAKLGEFAGNLGNWVVNDALPAIGKAIGDLIHKFQEIWPDIVEWGKSIPNKIMEGLGNLAEWAGNIGDEIAHGIAAGLGQGIDWIVNAVTSLGDQAMDAICNFFGIASPSKLMRDEVGQYLDLGLAEGIGKYAFNVIDQAKRMANNTTDAVNQGFGSIDSVSPTITPVLNMNSASTGLSNYLTDLGQIDFSGAASFAENLDANLDMTSLNTAFDNQSHEIAMLRDQNQQLLNEISALRADVSQYNDTMSRTSMILDSGALVGAMTPQIDRALGARMVRAERGVY